MLGMFCAVSGIGLTGPNAMAFAMSHQGARAGTASAVIGQYAICLSLVGWCSSQFLNVECTAQYGCADAWFCCCRIYGLSICALISNELQAKLSLGSCTEVR